MHAIISNLADVPVRQVHAIISNLADALVRQVPAIISNLADAPVRQVPAIIWNHADTLPLTVDLTPQTAPSPIRRLFHQIGFHGVGINIVDHIVQMVFIPYVSVEVFRLPEIAFSPKYLIRLVRRNRLPLLKNRGKWPSFFHLNQDMDVIRHDTPSDKVVPNAIVEFYCLFK